ncbi:MAG TPA: caspase family protein [Xanthobacteraceae bacterium]|nr:caspase family protein [Xanthobacteraceae bacterium]
MAIRRALVIGNSAYPSAPLKNARGDAEALAKRLTKLGFEVSCGLDLDLPQSVAHLASFETAIADADAAVMFFAGHGVQIGGFNYLIPIGVEIKQLTHLEFSSLPLNRILGILTRQARSSIIMLDACRKNPFERSLSSSVTDSERSPETIRSGLARVNDSTAKGSFIAFAAAPDKPAFDGGRRSHSPFTAALLKNIDKPDLSISDMMIKVRNDVLLATRGDQEPWDQNNLRERFCFNPASDSAENQSTKAGGGTVLTIDDRVIEHQRWQNLKEYGATIINLEDYIVSSPPNGLYWRDAVRLIEAKISACDDAGELRSFIERYPDSPRQTLVRKRLASVEWGKLANSSDPDKLRDFIETHEAVPERVAAQQRYGELVEPTLRVSRDLEALKAFVALVGETRYGRSGQQRIEAVERMIAAENEAWSRLQASGDSGQFRAFLAAHPDSSHVGQVSQWLKDRLFEERRLAEARRAEFWSRLTAHVVDLPISTAAELNRIRSGSAAALASLLFSDVLFVVLTAVAPNRGGAILAVALAALAVAFALRPLRPLTSLELAYAWIACLPAFVVGGSQLFSRLGLSLGALAPADGGLLFGCLLTIVSGAWLLLSRRSRFADGVSAVFLIGIWVAMLVLLDLLFQAEAAVSVWGVVTLLAALFLARSRWSKLTAAELAGYWFVASVAALVLDAMLSPTWPIFLILIPLGGVCLALLYRKRLPAGDSATDKDPERAAGISET